MSCCVEMSKARRNWRPKFASTSKRASYRTRCLVKCDSAASCRRRSREKFSASSCAAREYVFPDTRPRRNAAGLPTGSGQVPPGATSSENGSSGVIVGIVRRGDGANFRESLVAQEFAVFENRFESVVGRDGSAVDDFDRNEILAVLDEIEAASLAGFGRILLGIFVDVVPLAAAVDGGTFQREFQRVAVDLLQQRATHAVAPDVLRPALASELRGNVLNGVEVDAVALNETHARNRGLPAFAVYFVAEFFADDCEEFLEDGGGVA